MDERLTKEQMERDESLQERLTREGDVYAKHANAIDLLMAGIHPDTGRPMRHDDEGRLLDDDEDDDDDEGQDGVRVGDYSLNTCDRCGGTREPFVDLPGDLLCWDCYSGQLQADADRSYDEMRDREMWEGRE